jgi:hypothetical protein
MLSCYLAYSLICAFVTIQLWLLNVYLADVQWVCIKQYLYVWIIAIIQKWSVMTIGTRQLF